MIGSTGDNMASHTIMHSAIRAERIFLFESEDDLLITSRQRAPESAHDVQLRLLPTRPPQIDGFSIDAISIPAQEVGGDHFNFFSAGGDRLGVLIADVSGKGMPAALLATLLRATFRTQTWGNHDVHDVLTRANAFLSRVLPMGTFITAIYGILDVPSRRFTYGRAGHEPLLFKSAGGEIRLLTPFGLPLGVASDADFRGVLEVESIQLQPGDRLLLYTDGLTEAMNCGREEFGTSRILDALAASGGDDIAALRQSIDRHCGDSEPHDDLTMVSIRATY